MSVPTEVEVDSSVYVAAHTEIVNQIDSGSGPGKIRIRDAADAVIGVVDFSDPCGTVNPTTGQLTFSIAGTGTATIESEAAYCTLDNSDSITKMRIPAVAGTSAVEGKIVLNTLTFDVGATIEILSAVVG